MSIPIGLQLFAVRGEVEKDLPATLKAIAEIGYLGAEPWGYGGESLEWEGHSAESIRSMYDNNGLACCGFHITTDALRGDNLARTVDFNRTLGNRFLIVAMDQKRVASAAGVAELAGILNEASEKLAAEGMFAGYHAHGFDAAQLEDGRIAWEALFSATRPEVIMQMDIGNYASGGGDPIGMLRQFPNRARSVHLKEYGGAPGAIIGEGKMDWPEVFRLCETEQNTEWYVVEEGGPDGFGFDVCRRSLAALHKMGK